MTWNFLLALAVALVIVGVLWYAALFVRAFFGPHGGN